MKNGKINSKTVKMSFKIKAQNSFFKTKHY